MLTEDIEIRLAAFDWLKNQANYFGDIIPRKLLQTGFEFRSQKIPLVSPQGIFKPKNCNLPISITTTPKGPYKDNFDYDGLLRYSYRGSDIDHRDNVGLRELMKTNTPLIYFFGIIPGKYLPLWPVYIVDDNPELLYFSIAVDDAKTILDSVNHVVKDITSRRRYITSDVKVRLHQHTFREKVLRAYHQQCSFCRLRHEELLDAAHIIPDSDPMGEPTVTNGISLCKIHHAAFDRFFIGISPEYKIIVRKDILNEEDGPMLRYGLQKMHNHIIQLPANKREWPNQEYLLSRFEQFSKV